MSGDVQPRKRKDKKRKKDELGLEEPRGTAAVFGEGDVFMHSQHEHGTGGHWCAKIIFFSLLGILVGLIGLIILENRGLTELEANSIESRYSGVLEGWLEDTPDDDHHDEHTLDLNHPDEHDEDEAISEERYHASEEHEDEDEHDELETYENNNEAEEVEEQNDDEEMDQEGSDEDVLDDKDDEQNVSEEDDNKDEHDFFDNEIEDDDHDASDEKGYEEIEKEDADDQESEEDADNEEEDGYHEGEDAENEEDVDNDEEDVDNKKEDADNDEEDADNKEDDSENEEDDGETEDGLDNEQGDERDNIEGFQSDEDVKENKKQSLDNQDDEDEEVYGDDDDEDLEVERIEREAEDLEPVSVELPTLHEQTDDDSEEKYAAEAASHENEAQEDNDEDEDYLSEQVPTADEDIEAVGKENISPLSSKPYDEVEESSEQIPADTLADEEEYERRQQEIRREEEKASNLWLKLSVGAALLLATHAVVRRAAAGPGLAPAPADHETDGTDEEEVREETPPIVDRRMTLLPEDQAEESRAVSYDTKSKMEAIEPDERTSIKQTPIREIEDYETVEEEEEEELETIENNAAISKPDKPDKELYSSEEEENITEDEDENARIAKDEIVERPDTYQVADDVEIIDEQLEDEEEAEEEEISDVDDAELLSRLEAKYGRLPEPRGPINKDGGNSIDDWWPGEPSDPQWRRQLDDAQQLLHQGAWAAAAEAASAAALRGSARALWLEARALDMGAESRRDNRLLARAVAAYLRLLVMADGLSDTRLLHITNRTIDRIHFQGTYLRAEPVYRLLIRRFPNEPAYRNNLTISFLMANRADLAEEVLKETLRLWPEDRVALVHYGFVLKTQHNRLEDAVDLFTKALEGDRGPACEPRFYYHLGDSLLLLGRYSEAREVHKRGAALGHFLSPSQRSLYNVPRLKSQPWWDVTQTPYSNLARTLETSWREILREGEAARELYEQEKEGLREKGEWSQLDLFVRGREVAGRCERAPVTCAIVRAEPAAARCSRGQVKFSLMEPGTHVRPHVGPTNCRLRMHLGLSNTDGTYLRVDKQTRQWRVGKVLLFDDSFEHEVWHNGTRPRLVLIVDVWHPALTAAERRSLPAI